MNTFLKFISKRGFLLLGIGAGLILLYWLKGFFTKSDTAKMVDNYVKDHTNEVIQLSKDFMSTGDTYAVVAQLIHDMIYRGQSLAWLKNTDEKALGEVMLRVLKEEYSNLQLAYQLYKESNTSWYHFGKGGTLDEDLRGVFSKAEYKTYCGHLS